MIVECSACKTIFPVDPKKVPTAGIHARCSVCSEVFFVIVPEPEEESTEVEAQPAPAEEAVAELEVVDAEVTEEVADGEGGAVVVEEPLPPTEEAVPLIEEPAPMFEGAEATFARAEDVVEEATAEAPAREAEEISESVEKMEFAADETATEFDEPTFGSMDDVGVATETPSEAGPLFGKRDPKEKAQRLARVLVSDIILYNPDRHHHATESGRVKEEFEEEIQKSWNEYVEQVGEEIANSTSYFNDALNEILAKGEQIF